MDETLISELHQSHQMASKKVSELWTITNLLNKEHQIVLSTLKSAKFGIIRGVERG